MARVEDLQRIAADARLSEGERADAIAALKQIGAVQEEAAPDALQAELFAEFRATKFSEITLGDVLRFCNSRGQSGNNLRERYLASRAIEFWPGCLNDPESADLSFLRLLHPGVTRECLPELARKEITRLRAELS
jgi:hypothetical protein